MKKLSTLFCLFILWRPMAGQTQQFILTGHVTGLADSTWLYLRQDHPARMADSAQVVHGEFHLSARINEKAEQLLLCTEHNSNYVFFWAENKPMRMTLQADNFKHGRIEGSRTQNEQQQLLAGEESVRRLQDSLDKTKTRERVLQFDRDFIRNHSTSIVAAYLLNVYATTWGRDTTARLFGSLSPAMKDSRYGKDIRTYLDLNRNIRPGDRYVDFEEPDASGKMIRLSTIRGKYVLIDFWASWCGPCRDANPALVALYRQYKDKGLVIVGVSLDDNKDYWVKALKDDQLEWVNVSDLRGDKDRAALIYGISGIPDNFLIDEKGIVVARGLRGKNLEEKLQELFAR